MIEAIKLTKTIESATLTIQELERFQGQTVDIIILATSPQPLSAPRKKTRPRRKMAGGMLAKYSNPALWDQETTAWERAIEEKYAHR